MPVLIGFRRRTPCRTIAQINNKLIKPVMRQTIFLLMVLVLPASSSSFSNIGHENKLFHGAGASCFKAKDLALKGHVPEPEKSGFLNSNPIMIGDLYRLVSEGKLDAMREMLKSTDLETIRPELFYRDNLNQTPLSLAWKRRDKEMISFLLSLGKFQEQAYQTFTLNL